jgi:peptidoglycan/xylan/chitin deacetylase (PgdA/CDA1 family)
VHAMLAKALKLKRTGIVFAGHGVSNQYKSKFVEEVHIPFSDFKSVVETLQRLDFDFLSMEKVIEISRNSWQYPKHWVHLTFDDGYQNNFDLLYPYLRDKKIPFSVFVSTFNVLTNERFPTFLVRIAYEKKRDLNFALGMPKGEHSHKDYQQRVNFASPQAHAQYIENLKGLLTAEEIAEFYNDRPVALSDLKTMAQDPLVHIGSHSHKHILFHPTQDVRFMKENLSESKRLLREWGVEKNPTFCYPNGDHDANTAKLTAEAGYPLTFISRNGYVDSSVDPQLVPRFWLSTPARTLQICALSLGGNKILKLLRR